MSAKKVYRVSAQMEVEYFVVADSEALAEEVAGERFGDVLDDELDKSPTYLSVREVKALDAVPGEWRKASPYRPAESEDDRTIEQIFAGVHDPDVDPDAPQPAVKDEWTLPMFPETKS